jgi:hypothetical protein
MVLGMRTEAIGASQGDEPENAGEKRRKGRFWIPLVWAGVPTLVATLGTCFFWRLFELPEPVVGVLFFAVVLPAAVICEKLGFGQFSILGGSTVPDWVLFSVMIALVYLYSLVLVIMGRGVWRFAFQAKRAGVWP